VNAPPVGVCVVCGEQDAEAARTALRGVVAYWTLFAGRVPDRALLLQADALAVATRDDDGGRALEAAAGRVVGSLPKDRRPMRQRLKVDGSPSSWSAAAEWVEAAGYWAAERTGMREG
jgi:hypothetical protein